MGLCLPMFALCAALAAQEPKEPSTVLENFNQALLKAIKQFPKDQAARARIIVADKKVFDTDLRESQIKAPKNKWEYHQEYITHLINADKRFTTEENKPERQAWILACRSTFIYELARAQEPSLENLTTEEAFNEFFDAIAKVRKDILNGASSADIRTPAYVGAKQVFTERLRSAHGSRREPQQVYTEQLIRIDKTYPLPAPPSTQQTPVRPTGQSSGGAASSSRPSSGSGGGSYSPEPEKKPYDYQTEPNSLLKSQAKLAFDRALIAPGSK